MTKIKNKVIAEQIAYIVEYIDMVRLRKQFNAEVNSMALYIAEELDINPDVQPYKLANAFDNWLTINNINVNLV